MQQIPFIDLFISALHVSGDKLAHSQEHFLTVYTALVQCTDIAADRSAAISESLSPETCRADSNRSIKRCINKNCYILLVANIDVMLCNILARQRPQLDYILRLLNFPLILSNLMGLCLPQSNSGHAAAYWLHPTCRIFNSTCHKFD